MMGDIRDLLLDYLKALPFWSAIQPFVLLVLGWIRAEFLAYEYLRSQYDYEPSIRLFLGSYVSIRLMIAFAGLAAILVLFRIGHIRGMAAAPGRVGAFVRTHSRAILYRATVVVAVLAALVLTLRYVSPSRVSHIRIVFMDPPRAFDRHALAYLIYELNRAQKSWYFDVDFREFNPDTLTSAEARRCEASPTVTLCYAEAYARSLAPPGAERDIPLIGIASQRLGQSYFCQHRRTVSVITTADRDAFAPLSVYDYLLHCVIVQGILIHLEAHGERLPEPAFQRSDVSHGGVFQFNPEKGAIKATILAAHLSPQEEQVLLNRFGAEYTSQCAKLLTLEWLHSPRIQSNLQKYFAVKDANS